MAGIAHRAFPEKSDRSRPLNHNHRLLGLDARTLTRVGWRIS